MTIGERLLPEFDIEMQNTRRMLERLPKGKAEWKPHEKSMTMGYLAAHLADIPNWITVTMEQDELDFNPPGGEPYQTPTFVSTEGTLAAFDAVLPKARAALAGASDASFMANWSLKSGGQEMFSMPRIAVYRSFVMNHMIHHRGQMSVYLRLTGQPVPSTYGPSGDEGTM